MTEQIGKITLDLTHYPGEDLYCDGQVEDELLEIVRNYAQVEYPRLIEERKSWPILYHLSPLRENTVDWIPMKKTDKVLEVGSGCGAITGALARKAGEVVCVDLSKKRSQINAYRHSECENVTIHVGNFKDIEPELPSDFDYIYLVGVFEYAQGYMGEDKPYEGFLSMILKHLKAGGRAVIAMENKYGLKYFAGCREDHLGSFFSGIENYGEEKGVRTFSRRGLEKIFAACGVKQYHFYYPYPDYKFMTTLYSDAYLPGKSELSDNMRNFDRDRMLLFDEKQAFDGIVEENLFSVFANSYTVVIGEGFEVKYAKYSNDRAPEYRIRTEICRDGGGTALVKKYPLCKEAEEHVRGMAVAYRDLSQRYAGGEIGVNRCTLKEEEGEVYCSFEFLEGTLLSELMDDCLKRKDEQGFRKLFREYVRRTGYHAEDPVADFDLIFPNIIVQGDTWSIIDYEWTFGKAMETKRVAFRAVYCYLLENEWRNCMDLDWVLAELGVSQEEAAEYRDQEFAFQKFVTGKRLSMPEIRNLLGRQIIRPVKWLDRIAAQEAAERVQIYEDRGNGFSEEASYFVEDAYRDGQTVELRLQVDGDVQVVRIDPMMDSCVVCVEELTFNGNPVPLHNKSVFYANGKLLKPAAGAVFPTEDPNLYLKVAELDRQAENELYARMTVARLPLAAAEALALSVKKLI